MQMQKSISGYRVLLEDTPVMMKSSAQKSVALSVCEAEQSSGMCTRHAYCKNLLKSMGLKVKLPMLLEMDNKGVVDLANNWSVGGRTRHVDVRQCFLRELKESKIMASFGSKVQIMTQMCSLRIWMALHLRNASRHLLGMTPT